MPYRTTPKMLQRKEARRKKLLDAAVRLFGCKGYHSTTVPMIVRAANSSIGSFYFYFRNKDEIFAAVLEALGEQVSSALNDAIRASGSDVLVQMKAAVKALVQSLAENPEKARILIVESSGLGKRLEAVRRRVIASHTRSVEQALRALSGRLPPLEPATAASCWVGAVLEAVYYWLEQPSERRLLSENLAESIARFNLRGIGAPIEFAEEGKRDRKRERRSQPASRIST
jgi:AcrR family transcriptional regulator